MSRHRIVRTMNYEDEYYDDDDYDYGQSYEDRYCISPSTAAQFTYNRDQDFNLSSYMEEEIPEETEMDLEPEQAQAAASATTHGLNDIDKGRLQSCMEEIHNVMGDAIPDSVLTEAIMRHSFNIQSTLDELLSRSDGPKPQRTPRKKRDRTQGDDSDIEDLLSEISALDEQENMPFKGLVGRFSFQAGLSPPTAITLPATKARNLGIRQSSCEVAPSPVGSPHNIGEGSSLVSTNMSTGAGSIVNASPSVEGSSLMSLIQRQQHSQVHKLSCGPPATNPGLSLSELAGLHNKKDTTQPVPALSSQNEAKQSGLSLSELISARKGPSQQIPTVSSSAGVSKPESGLSLSELVASQSRQSVSSSPTSSDISSSSQASGAKGLSLTELVSLHTDQKKAVVSSVPSTEKKGSESSQGVSLSQLVKTHSSQHREARSTPQGSIKTESKNHGISLADLVKAHSKETSVVQDRDKKDFSLSSSSKLLLSDLVSNRQEGIRQPGATSLKDVNANTTQKEAGSHSTNSLETLRKRPHEEEVKDLKGKADVTLSLVDCLKKSLTIRKEDPKKMPSLEIEEMEEEESMMLPDKTMDVEVSFFYPQITDPALRKIPSLFARCICLRLMDAQKMKRNTVTPASKFAKKNVRFPTFMYKHQTRKLKVVTEAPLHKVERFDFTTPSPDDIVKMRQRAAFMRSGQHVPEENNALGLNI